MNKVNLIGNIVNDPELRYTTNNKAIATFRIAVRRNYRNQDGTYSSDFINCKTFGRLAEVIQKYCKRGNRIGVVGRIETNTYEVNNQKRYSVEIVVEEFEFLTKKPNDNIPQETKEEQETFTYTDEEGEELPFD